MKPVTAIVACALVVFVAGAGCFCDPPAPPNFVYSCSGTLECPPTQTCGVCSGGQVPPGSRVCGPPETPGVCDGWTPIGAATGALVAAALDVDGDGLDDFVAGAAADGLLDTSLLPRTPPDETLTGDAAMDLLGEPTVYVWLTRAD